MEAPWLEFRCAVTARGVLSSIGSVIAAPMISDRSKTGDEGS
jgi:hypothetical protein